MNHHGAPQSPGPDASRLFMIATAVAIMVLAIWILVPAPPAAPRGAAAPAPSLPPATHTEPIAVEAQVFRTTWDFVGAALDAVPRPEARARTLEIYRRLRAYPGAPPRVPHGLTHEEFRTNRCLVCHERGGFAARFGAYAPVTPHPEYAECVQCHGVQAMSVGVPLPGQTGGLVCQQCHVNPDEAPPSLVAMDWVADAWPAVRTVGIPGGPPIIPPGHEARANCLACHGGPGAVRELRTPHPERSNCRQCHVTQDPGVGAFERAAAR